MPLSPERKAEYFDRMKTLLSSYTKCFIVLVDNVGSQQLQEPRKALRGTAELLMGKNTMMRKVISDLKRTLNTQLVFFLLCAEATLDSFLPTVT